MKNKIFKGKTLLYSLMFTGLVLLVTSCKKEVDFGSNATVRNTFQSPNFGIPNEIPFGDTLTAEVGEGVEFVRYLGIYDIDIYEDKIDYLVTATEADSAIAALFRVIEAGTFDRYYITFDEDQKFESASVNNNAVTASIISAREIKVEIGEGFDFKSGAGFSIQLEK